LKQRKEKFFLQLHAGGGEGRTIKKRKKISPDDISREKETGKVAISTITRRGRKEEGGRSGRRGTRINFLTAQEREKGGKKKKKKLSWL